MGFEKRKRNRFTWKLWLIITALIAVAIGWISIKVCKKADNPIEEACEEIIRSNTGIDIDLSLGSKE